MYTNSRTTASYLKLFVSYIEYLMDRIFTTNICLFAFSSVACWTFNSNEKVVSSAGFNAIYR